MRSGRLGRLWRRVRRPKVLVPLFLAAALLGAALGLTDVPRALHRIAAISPGTVAAVFGLAGVYLAVKGLQLRAFLRDLGLDPGWRPLALAYAVGELGLTLPLGIYGQNVLLDRFEAGSGYRSAAATTAMLLLETGLVFATLAVLGVPGWAWVRPAALVGLAGAAGVFALLARSRRLRRLVLRAAARLPIPRRAPLAFLRGLGTLARPGRLVRRAVLTVVYLAALVAAFDVLAHGAGATGLTPGGAASIYAFSLSAALVFGSVTSQVGVVEIAGMGAAGAAGFGYTEGLAMLLGFRLVWTASIWLMALPVVVALRRELTDSGADRLEEPRH